MESFSRGFRRLPSLRLPPSRRHPGPDPGSLPGRFRLLLSTGSPLRCGRDDKVGWRGLRVVPPHPEERCGFASRLEGRGIPAGWTIGVSAALVLRDADPSGSAPQDEGWESFPRRPPAPTISPTPQSLRHPGLDPGSLPGRFRLLRMEIPALRFAAAGMTGVGEVDAGLTRWHVGVHSEVPPRRPFPERWSAAEPCPGSSTKMRLAAALSCLKTKWKRASRGIKRWTPDTLPLSLQGSGDVRRGRTLGFRGRAAGPHFGVPGDVPRAALGVPGTCRTPSRSGQLSALRPSFPVCLLRPSLLRVFP